MLAGDLACKVARIPAVVSARYYETTGKGAGRGSARRRRRGLRDPRPDVDAIIPTQRRCRPLQPSLLGGRTDQGTAARPGARTCGRQRRGPGLAKGVG